jgi:hypothetical protein
MTDDEEARRLAILLPDVKTDLPDIEHIDTTDGAVAAVVFLRRVISAWHGEGVANCIIPRFTNQVRFRQTKNDSLLSLCGFMGPKLNVRQLAKRLAEENRTLPKAEQWGPRGTTNARTMEAQIRRLRKYRAKRKE